jgi:hypothetical protein
VNTPRVTSLNVPGTPTRIATVVTIGAANISSIAAKHAAYRDRGEPLCSAISVIESSEPMSRPCQLK